MTKLPDSVEVKTNNEQQASEMGYESQFEWRLMKKLRSETQVRHWHVKVNRNNVDNKGREIWEDYNILQTWIAKDGEKLFGYRATRSGRPVNICDVYFQKPGSNHLHGIEYLLRMLEGQDISQLRLDKED